MRTVKDLLGNYQHIIEELRLITGSKGVFEVVVDGAVLYSKHTEGRHAEPGEVLARFVEAYAEDITPYEK